MKITNELPVRRATMGWNADPCPRCGAAVEKMTTEKEEMELDGVLVTVTPEPTFTLFPCGHGVNHVTLDHNTGRATYTR